MSLCEFTYDVRARRLPRMDRKVTEEAADVGRQVRRHRVTLCGIAIDCPSDDGVEVAAHAPLLAMGIGDLRRGIGWIVGHRRVQELCTGRGLRPERMQSCHQDVKQHAQRIHIGRRGQRFTPHLFGSGITGGQLPSDRPNGLLRRRCIRASLCSAATPKSTSLTAPSCVTNTFEGLRSPWTMS